MGIAAGDFDGDGDIDLFVTTYDPETNTLRVNDGKGFFLDLTDRYALGFPSLSYTGWGTEWLDVDNDGALDLFVANGGILEVESRRGVSARPYEQRNQLFLRGADGRFALAPARAGLALVENSRGAVRRSRQRRRHRHRGCEQRRSRALLENRARGAQHWLACNCAEPERTRRRWGRCLAVAGRQADADAAHTQRRKLSQRERPARAFRAGWRDRRRGCAVVWPDGRIEHWQGLATDRYHTLREGEGEAEHAP